MKKFRQYLSEKKKKKAENKAHAHRHILKHLGIMKRLRDS